MAYFPMFVDISQKKCLIVGGGKVALRKAKAMSYFDAAVYVIAANIIQEIKDIKAITWYEKEIQLEDIDSYDIVIAATDNKMLNHSIYTVCKEKKIPINSVDNIENCTFIFPAYIKQKDVVAAFSSGGKCPVVSQYLKEEMEKIMPCCIGDIAGYIGDIREDIKNRAITEPIKKEIYREILELCIKTDGVPQKAVAEEIIERKINNAATKQQGKNIY